MRESQAERIQRFKQIIQRRLDNGQTVKEFCAAEGCSEGAYYHMVTEVHRVDPMFNTGGMASAFCATGAGMFVEITPKGRRSTLGSPGKAGDSRMPAAEIQVGTATVSLFANADAQFLCQLLEAVQDA
ncbi:MAG: hypothetical protein LUC41_08775 [Clostridiales bacterium]|nr:hypothetical protein [Clostridiales bacterium]